MGLVPAGTYNNKDYISHDVHAENIEDCFIDVLYDPQTSGGLLITLPASEVENIMKDKSYRIKFDASIGKGSYNRYYAVFCNKNGDNMVLIFNPTTDMLKKFKLFNPEIIKFEE